MRMQVQRADLGMPSGQTWGRTADMKPCAMLVADGFAVKVVFEYEECKIFGQSAIYVAIDAELEAQRDAPPAPADAPGIRAASSLYGANGLPLVSR